MAHAENLERLEITDPAQLGAWLAENHGQTTSVWLVTHRKAAGALRVPYDRIVEELLAWGWVDSLPRKLDEHRSMLLISPRKSRSAWSAANKARVAKLIAENRMRPPGAASVAEARANGAWSFLDDVEALTIPDDLAAALAAQPPAASHFAGFPRSIKRGILEWIKQAKRPETRAARLLETATLARDNRRANQFRARPPDPPG